MEEIRIICNKNKGIYTVLLFTQRVRVPYIVAHHVIKFIKQVVEKDVMRDALTILTFIFAKTLINSKIQITNIELYLSYDVKLILQSRRWCNKVEILPKIRSVDMGIIS